MKEPIEIVFASHNENKVKEIAKMLEGMYRVLSLRDIGCNEEIPETGSTLEENASIKARFVAQNFGKDCFADDTGLEVEALNGEPGVYSARYAGEEKSSEKNMKKLLESLEGKANRKARFRTAICLIHRGNEQLFEGIVNGYITNQKSGTEGFGYDPIFQPEGFQTTFAEMTDTEKNAISHRGRAVKKLINFLQDKR